ncbi:MAG TPA: DUF2480 family protein [Saprospiraceae bacterium]|nr:DUF2480 family protein [Saprospiraceae bacterium]
MNHLFPRLLMNQNKEGTMEETLVNKISESGLITLKPEEWIPEANLVTFDIKDFLFMGQILKEKDFREAIKTLDWMQYKNKILCVFCSADAIIPNWAYMLVATQAAPYAESVYYGNPDQWRSAQLIGFIEKMEVKAYQDQRVIIKGCSEEFNIGPEIYVALTSRLVPVVKSLMFGEPCSTVPVYKRPKGN